MSQRFRKKNLAPFRALFPRWSFFDRLGHQFVLEFRQLAPRPMDGRGGWWAVDFDQPRSLFGLFVNPRGNLAMAEVNVVEHFVADLQELQGNPVTPESSAVTPATLVQELPSFRMLQSLLRAKLQDALSIAVEGEFRVLVNEAGARHEVYVSPPFAVGKS